MSIVYLAGPVDDVDAATASLWREEVSKHLVVWDGGHACYVPQAPWIVAQDGLSQNAGLIDYVNRYVIRAAVAVIANLSGPGRAIGTIREIEYARSVQCPVCVFVPHDIPPTVALHDLHVVRVGADFWADSGQVYDALTGFWASMVNQEQGWESPRWTWHS